MTYKDIEERYYETVERQKKDGFFACSKPKENVDGMRRFIYLKRGYILRRVSIVIFDEGFDARNLRVEVREYQTDGSIEVLEMANYYELEEKPDGTITYTHSNLEAMKKRAERYFDFIKKVESIGTHIWL